MMVTGLRHRELRQYLSRCGPEGLFARYVAEQRPEESSPAVIRNDAVVGVGMTGRTCGLFEAFPTWILCDDVEACEALLPFLPDPLPMNLPIDYEVALRQWFPDISLSTDLLYLLEREDFRAVRSESELVRLTPQLLRSIDIPDEIAPMIGPPDALPDGFPLFGVIESESLVGIADCSVRDGSFGAVQQVYVCRTLRGAGLGSRIVAGIVERLLEAGLTPLYLVAETNLPSIALAERLGFRCASRWCCGDMENV